VADAIRATVSGHPLTDVTLQLEPRIPVNRMESSLSLLAIRTLATLFFILECVSVVWNSAMAVFRTVRLHLFQRVASAGNPVQFFPPMRISVTAFISGMISSGCCLHPDIPAIRALQACTRRSVRQ
jgi:hypothetical protein